MLRILRISEDYFSVTLAPTSSSLALIASASSLEACSFRTLGALSTASLASFRPRPVTSRTTLITLIFSEPTSVSSTSNSVFSAAASPAAGPATTATPAGCGYAEFFFCCFYQIIQFQYCQFFYCCDDFFDCQFCHCKAPPIIFMVYFFKFSLFCKSLCLCTSSLLMRFSF